MRIISLTLIAAVICTLIAAPALGGGHYGPDGLKPEKFGNRSGFRGHEEALGTAVAEAIRDASPNPGDPRHDFAGREMELGKAVESLLKALNNRKPYQHEPNDALIKATLTSIQFAKDNGLMEAWIEAQARTQMPLITRVGKLIDQTGDIELGMLGLTERTACFYQLVLDYERDGPEMRWRSPYWNVLAQTRRLGQHDLTEQWIHENYTVPVMKRRAEGMGLVAEISDWQEDGWVSMRLVRPESVAATR
jgi:hypothetical protein